MHAILILSLMIYCESSFSKSLNPIQLDSNESWYCLQDYGEFLSVKDNYKEASEVLVSDQWQSWDEISFDKTENDIWIHFFVNNPKLNHDSVFFNGQLFDFVELYEVIKNEPILISKSGYMVPFKERPIREWGTIVCAYLSQKSKKEFLLRFKSASKNSQFLMSYVTGTCIKSYTSSGIEDTYKLPTYLVFFFYGAIFMMMIYNLGISLSTQFKEYLLFSLYNFLTVVTAFLISGHHIEYHLVPAFDYERNLRYIPAMLVVFSYLMFAIKFLDLKNYSVLLFKVISRASLVYFILIVGLLLSWYDLVFIVFTLLTSCLFATTLITSLIKSKTDKTARFFAIGNLIVCSVGLLQLASLYSLINTTSMAFGCYIILMAEIVVFSFAVAYKLKVSRRAMLDMKFKNQMQTQKLAIESEMRRKLELEVDEKARSLTSSSVQWLNMSTKLDQLRNGIKEKFKELDPKGTKKMLKQIDGIKQFEDQWNAFKIHFESVHSGFFEHLEKIYPSLTQNDLKLCAFMKMKLSNKEMAIILNVTKKAIEQSKRRMRKKLGLEPEQDILKTIERSTKMKLSKNAMTKNDFLLKKENQGNGLLLNFRS